MRIGFIGLGNMGAPMAANLAAAGHDVRGFDVSDVTAAGVRQMPSAAAACEESDAIITMLPNGAILLDVYEEIGDAVQAGALMIDCSTVDVASAAKAHDVARSYKALSLDAPVSGGIAGAAAGTLTFMVGGSKAAFERSVELFDILGGKTVHCGDNGAGQAAKICNNMLLGISMIGACEAFSLARKLGLDQARLFDVVSTSSGSCWSVNTYCPVPGVGPKSPADNDYKPGFAAELMLKDLALAQQAATDVDAHTPLGREAREVYERFVAGSGKGLDFSAVLTYVAALGQDDPS